MMMRFDLVLIYRPYHAVSRINRDIQCDIHFFTIFLKICFSKIVILYPPLIYD